MGSYPPFVQNPGTCHQESASRSYSEPWSIGKSLAPLEHQQCNKLHSLLLLTSVSAAMAGTTGARSSTTSMTNSKKSFPRAENLGVLYDVNGSFTINAPYNDLSFFAKEPGSRTEYLYAARV